MKSDFFRLAPSFIKNFAAEIITSSIYHILIEYIPYTHRAYTIYSLRMSYILNEHVGYSQKLYRGE
jgi:hypothetical protein